MSFYRCSENWHKSIYFDQLPIHQLCPVVSIASQSICQNRNAALVLFMSVRRVLPEQDKSVARSQMKTMRRAPSDYPSGKEGDVLTVEFTVCGVHCIALNGGPEFKHSEAFSFQIATDTQEETDRLWNAIVSNEGKESECGWCKDRWGLSWQITPRVLTDALAAGGATAKRAFAAMMKMRKIDVAAIEKAVRDGAE